MSKRTMVVGNEEGLRCRAWRWLRFYCVMSVLNAPATASAWMLLPMISPRPASLCTSSSKTSAASSSSLTPARRSCNTMSARPATTDNNDDSGGTEKSSKQQPKKRRMFAQDTTVVQEQKSKQVEVHQPRPARRRQNGGRPTFRTDSDLMSSHLERIRTAGREGSINFIDPCRVFFGNLALSVNSEDLRDFVADHHRLPASFLIVDAEVITDWRTGQSKGYGFVRYTESVYATNALNTCNGKVWNGRRLMVQAAINAKKQKEVKRQRDLYEERKVKRELAIQNGELVKPVSRRPASLIPTDPRGEAFLRGLDPGLVDSSSPAKASSDTTTTAAIEGDSAPMMNREQRRKEERSKPKVKPVSKGFGV